MSSIQLSPLVLGERHRHIFKGQRHLAKSNRGISDTLGDQCLELAHASFKEVKRNKHPKYIICLQAQVSFWDSELGA